eukprot:2195254-Rhodomonas_salina.2
MGRKRRKAGMEGWRLGVEGGGGSAGGGGRGGCRRVLRRLGTEILEQIGHTLGQRRPRGVA